ncbi:hypothetical protein U1Q18_014466 [Sarracenia purpurea var. burkii]
MPESIPPNPARSIAVRAEAEVDKHRDKQNSSHAVAETMLATSVAAGPGRPLSWATVVTTNGASRATLSTPSSLPKYPFIENLAGLEAFRPVAGRGLLSDKGSNTWRA